MGVSTILLQEAVTWAQSPVPNNNVGTVWTCDMRKYRQDCGEEEDSNSTSTSRRKQQKEIANPFGSIIDVNRIWIWQCVVLVIAFFLIVRYDRMKHAKRK